MNETGRARPRNRIKRGSRSRRKPSSRSHSARLRVENGSATRALVADGPFAEQADLAGHVVGVVAFKFDRQDRLGRLVDPAATRGVGVASQADRPAVEQVARRRRPSERPSSSGHERRGVGQTDEREQRRPPGPPAAEPCAAPPAARPPGFPRNRPPAGRAECPPRSADSQEPVARAIPRHGRRHPLEPGLTAPKQRLKLADDQVLEIGRLGLERRPRLKPQVGHLALGEDDAEPIHVVAGRSITHRPRPRGIDPDHPSDRGDVAIARDRLQPAPQRRQLRIQDSRAPPPARPPRAPARSR